MRAAYGHLDALAAGVEADAVQQRLLHGNAVAECLGNRNEMLSKRVAAQWSQADTLSQFMQVRQEVSGAM